MWDQEVSCDSVTDILQDLAIFCTSRNVYMLEQLASLSTYLTAFWKAAYHTCMYLLIIRKYHFNIHKTDLELALALYNVTYQCTMWCV